MEERVIKIWIGEKMFSTTNWTQAVGIFTIHDQDVTKCATETPLKSKKQKDYERSKLALKDLSKRGRSSFRSTGR